MALADQKRCRLEVECSATEFGDQLCLVGEASSMGSWKPALSLTLATDEHCFPKWYLYLDELVIPEGGCECKFLIRKASGCILWETLAANRFLPAGMGRRGLVRAHFGMPGMAIVDIGGFDEEDATCQGVRVPIEQRCPGCDASTESGGNDERGESSESSESQSWDRDGTDSDADADGDHGSLSPAIVIATTTQPQEQVLVPRCETLVSSQAQGFCDEGFGIDASGLVKSGAMVSSDPRTMGSLRTDDYLAKFAQEIGITNMLDCLKAKRVYEHAESEANENFHLVLGLSTGGGDCLDFRLQSPARDSTSVEARAAPTTTSRILKLIMDCTIRRRQVPLSEIECIKPAPFIFHKEEAMGRDTIKLVDRELFQFCSPSEVLIPWLSTPPSDALTPLTPAGIGISHRIPQSLGLGLERGLERGLLSAFTARSRGISISISIGSTDSTASTGSTTATTTSCTELTHLPGKASDPDSMMMLPTDSDASTVASGSELTMTPTTSLEQDEYEMEVKVEEREETEGEERRDEEERSGEAAEEEEDVLPLVMMRERAPSAQPRMQREETSRCLEANPFSRARPFRSNSYRTKPKKIEMTLPPLDE